MSAEIIPDGIDAVIECECGHRERCSAGNAERLRDQHDARCLGYLSGILTRPPRDIVKVVVALDVHTAIVNATTPGMILPTIEVNPDMPAGGWAVVRLIDVVTGLHWDVQFGDGSGTSFGVRATDRDVDERIAAWCRGEEPTP